MRSARSAGGSPDRPVRASTRPAAIAASSTAWSRSLRSAWATENAHRPPEQGRHGRGGALAGRRSQPSGVRRAGAGRVAEEPRPRPLPPACRRRRGPGSSRPPRRWSASCGPLPARSSSAGGRRVARGPRSGATHVLRQVTGGVTATPPARCIVPRRSNARPGGDRTDSHPVLAGTDSPNPRGTSFRSSFEPAAIQPVAALDTSAAEAQSRAFGPPRPIAHAVSAVSRLFGIARPRAGVFRHSGGRARQGTASRRCSGSGRSADGRPACLGHPRPDSQRPDVPARRNSWRRVSQGRQRWIHRRPSEQRRPAISAIVSADPPEGRCRAPCPCQPRKPFVMVLDDAQNVTSRESLDVLQPPDGLRAVERDDRNRHTQKMSIETVDREIRGSLRRVDAATLAMGVHKVSCELFGGLELRVGLEQVSEIMRADRGFDRGPRGRRARAAPTATQRTHPSLQGVRHVVCPLRPPKKIIAAQRA